MMESRPDRYGTVTVACIKERPEWDGEGRLAGTKRLTTSEKNIPKVIEPPFLDDLKAEFFQLKARKDRRHLKDLKAFHDELGNLAIFDPACGSGNFLVIAYRELRELEIEVCKRSDRNLKELISCLKLRQWPRSM